MNEALKLQDVSNVVTGPQFKDGDDGGSSELHSLVVNVVDNGYILSGVLADSDGEIDIQEVYNTTDELLARMKELLCM